MFKWIKRKKNQLNIIPVEENKFTKNVPSCNGNRYVISDIHGCLQTLEKLISKIDLKEEDQLFFLGDYIDKGNNSRGVLDFIINLSNDYQIFPIKGNHEEDFEILLDIKSERLFERYLQKQSNSILNNDFTVNSEYTDFIKGLPYFYELENHFLVHAGFNFNQEKHFENTDEMLWIRTWDYDNEKAKNKTIIHGHDVNTLSEIKENIKNKGKIIPLDNGCVFSGADEYGNLLCYNISTDELIIQKNIEK